MRSSRSTSSSSGSSTDPIGDVVVDGPSPSSPAAAAASPRSRGDDGVDPSAPSAPCAVGCCRRRRRRGTGRRRGRGGCRCCTSGTRRRLAIAAVAAVDELDRDRCADEVGERRLDHGTLLFALGAVGGVRHRQRQTSTRYCRRTEPARTPPRHAASVPAGPVFSQMSAVIVVVIAAASGVVAARVAGTSVGSAADSTAGRRLRLGSCVVGSAALVRARPPRAARPVAGSRGAGAFCLRPARSPRRPPGARGARCVAAARRCRCPPRRR